MKRIIGLTLIIVFMFSCSMCFAETSSNKQIVQNYCSAHYPKMKVKYFTKWNENMITHRTDKNVVYVQIEKSISSGKKDSRNGRYWGYVKGQRYYKTWYNKKVKKGKTVTSYYIYNPYTNYTDDIIAVIDNKKIR